MISQAEGPAEPNPAQICASKRKQAKIEESKTAFFCLRLFFVIDTFQWVRGESNKKSSPRFRLLEETPQASRSPCLRGGVGASSATMKGIARISIFTNTMHRPSGSHTARRWRFGSLSSTSPRRRVDAPCLAIRRAERASRAVLKSNNGLAAPTLDTGRSMTNRNLRQSAAGVGLMRGPPCLRRPRDPDQS
jgi:hypothetical protein